VARASRDTPAGRFYDKTRPGAKRTITDEQVEDAIIRTLETTPSQLVRKTPGQDRIAGECGSLLVSGMGVV
jgi:hypothetical protein